MTGPSRIPPRVEAEVFVLDDDAAVCDSLGLLLGTAGYLARTFTRIPAMFDALSGAERPGCAILDVWLADGDGRDVARRLRRDAPGLPVVLMSVSDRRSLAGWTRATGAFGFLEKPVVPAELFHIVDRAAVSCGQSG